MYTCGGTNSIRSSDQSENLEQSDPLILDTVRKVCEHGRAPFHRANGLQLDTNHVRRNSLNLSDAVPDAEQGSAAGAAAFAAIHVLLAERKKGVR